MPLAPPRACPCGGRIISGKCSRCGPKARARDKNRPNFRDRGYSWRWSQYSLNYRKCNPLCRQCESNGLAVAATCVDHIIPHKGDEELFWNPDNHQPLCEKCHNAKSAKEK